MNDMVKEPRPKTRKAQPTIGGSVYIKPQDTRWSPTQFEGISIKVLYEDKAKGEMTCILKWEPGVTLPRKNTRRSNRPTSSKARSTTTTASAAPASTSGAGSGRSTRPNPTRAR